MSKGLSAFPMTDSEKALLSMCADAGELGCVVPANMIEAETLAAMKLIRFELRYAVAILPAGRAALASRAKED